MDQSQSSESNGLTTTDIDAVKHLREAISRGQPWYTALLESIGMWQSADEEFGGRHYCYLIDGEAFDWLLLAERLLDAVDGLVPDEERAAFLLRGQPPIDITTEQLRDSFGERRYRQHLNYHYGVTVERALVLAVQDEIRKERNVAGLVREQENADEAFRRIYGTTETALLEVFRRERHYRRLKSISLEEYKEFTYWLFKYRLRHSDRSRVASDTRKALDWINRNGVPRGLFNGRRPLVVDS